MEVLRYLACLDDYIDDVGNVHLSVGGFEHALQFQQHLLKRFSDCQTFIAAAMGRNRESVNESTRVFDQSLVAALNRYRNSFSFRPLYFRSRTLSWPVRDCADMLEAFLVEFGLHMITFRSSCQLHEVDDSVVNDFITILSKAHWYRSLHALITLVDDLDLAFYDDLIQELSRRLEVSMTNDRAYALYYDTLVRLHWQPSDSGPLSEQDLVSRTMLHTAKFKRQFRVTKIELFWIRSMLLQVVSVSFSFRFCFWKFLSMLNVYIRQTRRYLIPVWVIDSGCAEFNCDDIRVRLPKSLQTIKARQELSEILALLEKSLYRDLDRVAASAQSHSNAVCRKMLNLLTDRLFVKYVSYDGDRFPERVSSV
jgi:hypothetical protein